MTVRPDELAPDVADLAALARMVQLSLDEYAAEHSDDTETVDTGGYL